MSRKKSKLFKNARMVSVFLALLCVSMVLLLSVCGEKEPFEHAPFPQSHYPSQLASRSADACVDCHASQVAAWESSHHAHANISFAEHCASDTGLSAANREIFKIILKSDCEQPVVLETAKGKLKQRYAVAGLIGHSPLVQMLVSEKGGRWQAFDQGFVVDQTDWVGTLIGEREPGDWGHWQGQGANWNANCAWCHMTEYQKNFDYENNRYDSAWLEQGLGCGACHTGLGKHVTAWRAGQDSATKLRMDGGMALCGSCHSRRDQLAGDVFPVGAAFDSQFHLMTAETPGLYYPDGQIRDEVFVLGSFVGSKMHDAGVNCANCHDPHSGGLRLPVEDNQLCMQCHGSGSMNAPIIVPTAHSHHANDSAGNQCVNCHMPKTVYMGADPRADHGFHSPDPTLTRDLGVPNACNQCHQDKGNDWQLSWSEKWFAEGKAVTAQRQRAELMAQLEAGEQVALQTLLKNINKQKNDFWRASFTSYLDRYLYLQSSLKQSLVEQNSTARQALNALNNLAEDNSALVRARAAGILGSWDSTSAVVQKLKVDTSRDVRLALAQGLLAARQLPIADPLWQELKSYLTFHRDRPQALLGLANMAVITGDGEQIEPYIERAAALDQGNSEIISQGVILLSQAGRPQEAEALLLQGLKKFPGNAVFPYYLGLMAAERNKLSDAARYLEQATVLEPSFQRAWYNLAIIYQKQQRWPEAAAAQRRAK